MVESYRVICEAINPEDFRRFGSQFRIRQNVRAGRSGAFIVIRIGRCTEQSFGQSVGSSVRFTQGAHKTPLLAEGVYYTALVAQLCLAKDCSQRTAPTCSSYDRTGGSL